MPRLGIIEMPLTAPGLAAVLMHLRLGHRYLEHLVRIGSSAMAATTAPHSHTSAGLQSVISWTSRSSSNAR